MAEPEVFPYIPNSVPEVKQRMLDKVGIESVEEIYKEIPDHLRLKRRLDTPGPISSEYALKRHCEELLEDGGKGADCKKYIGFLGGGIWNHYVPSVVTTIMERDEFLSSYVGESFADHGKWQAQFAPVAKCRHWLSKFTRLQRYFILSVLLELKTRNLVSMHLVRTIGKPDSSRPRVGICKSEITRHPSATVHLNRPVNHLAGHIWGDYLYHANLLPRLPIAGFVHFIGGVEH